MRLSTSSKRPNRRGTGGSKGMKRTPPAKGGKGPRGPRGQGPKLCSEEGCGRPAYARGYCQTHHRQLLTTGKTQPIRPYRKRSPGTVKFSGLRLSPQCAGQIEEYAERRNISQGAAIASILEEWLVKG